MSSSRRFFVMASDEWKAALRIVHLKKPNPVQTVADIVIVWVHKAPFQYLCLVSRARNRVEMPQLRCPEELMVFSSSCLQTLAARVGDLGSSLEVESQAG